MKERTLRKMFSRPISLHKQFDKHVQTLHRPVFLGTPAID